MCSAPGPILGTAGAFLLLDSIILVFYSRAKRFYGGSATFYGKKLQWHIHGCLLCILSGALAILRHPWPTLAAIHGLAAMFLCGPTAVALAPYTAGHKGLVLGAYSMAGLVWSYAGLRVILNPSSLNPLFQLFIFSHTFAIVRLIFWLHWVLNLPAEKDPHAYDAAAFCSLLATMVIAWGKAGALVWAAIFCLALVGELSGSVQRLHVLYKGGSRYQGYPAEEVGGRVGGTGGAPRVAQSTEQSAKDMSIQEKQGAEREFAADEERSPAVPSKVWSQET